MMQCRGMSITPTLLSNNIAMSTKNRNIWLYLIVSGLAIATPAKGLTVEDFCDPKISKPLAIRAITPLSDGMTYSAGSED